MRIAQALYEGIDLGGGPTGLITYMRTDSVSVARSAQEACLQFVREQYGEAYAPTEPNTYRSRGSAQEAHEAIRPTDVGRTPAEMASRLKPDELRLYRIIWERFVASQMAPAVIAQRTAEIEAVPPSTGGRAYLFRATASEVVFPGYMKVLGGGRAKARKPANGGDAPAEESDEVERLPPLEEGEELDRLEWTSEQKFTQPPPRYSEATLVRALEENGIGRPSTYAQTLSTLVDRKYVVREKRMLHPTEAGERVHEFLAKNLDALFNVRFTAEMEASLDEIERGTVKWTDMLSAFYEQLKGWISEAKGPAGDPVEIARILELLSGVTQWDPPVKRGKRTYSDEAFVESLRKQSAEKPLSGLQTRALKRLAARYLGRAPGLAEAAGALGIAAEPGEGGEAAKPRPASLRKLELLAAVPFEEPRTVGKRVFDDRAFWLSLRERAESGRRLSEAQVKYLDRLFLKYAAHVPGFEQVAKELDLHAAEAAEGGADMEEARRLVEQLARVREWRAPSTRGRRTWDDHAFFDSLAKQMEQKRRLSPKQVAVLRRMAKHYASQLDAAEGAAAAPAAPPPGEPGAPERAPS